MERSGFVQFAERESTADCKHFNTNTLRPFYNRRLVNGLKTIVIFAFLLALCSCTNNSNTDIKREKAVYTTITDSLYTSFPGSMLYTGKYIVWTDPFSDTFMHVVDPLTGETVKSIVNIGQGPYEFSTPEVAVYNEDTVYVRDLNDDKEAYIQVSPDCQNFTTSKMKDDRFRGADTYLPVSANQWLSFGTFEGQEKPFAYANGSDYTRFGKFYFDETFDNKYICQGSLAFNREKKILVYAVSNFPYMASYKIDKDISLIWENSSKIDYTLTGNNIQLSKDNHQGGYNVVLTKNHIVTMEYDYDADKVEYPKGRDFKNVPHKLFIRDYDGKLERILNVEKPICRIAADESSDFVYAIIVDPEFSIIKIDCNE